MEIGPSLPPHLLKKGKHSLTESEETVEVGPTLPLHLLNKKQRCEPGCEEEEEEKEEEEEQIDEKEEEKDDDDAYGPALPPHLFSNKRNVPIGPALPPGMIKAATSEDDHHVKHRELDQSKDDGGDDDDDDDDDDIGPVIGPLPSTSTSESYVQRIERDIEARSKSMKDKLQGKNVVKQKREEWMTELPPEMGKNFGLGPRTFRRQAVELGDRSVWTDTPADKARKLAGSSSKMSADETSYKTPWEEEKEKHMKQMIKEYNKTNRGESLLDKHQKKMKKQKEEEGMKPNERRPFDRDKDLASPMMDPSKRKSLINKSQELGSRFQHSKGGSSYL